MRSSSSTETDDDRGEEAQEVVAVVVAEVMDTSKCSSSRVLRSDTVETVLEDMDSSSQIEEDKTTDEDKPVRDDEHPAPVSATLDPPLRRSEQVRDWVLRLLDSLFFQVLGLIVLLLVIIDGAFFFFLLVGWDNMCAGQDSSSCDTHSYWYNWSLQVLTLLFSYMSIVSMPWRCANLFHLTCPNRSNAVGHNLHGLPDQEVWFHISIPKRLGITILLVWNAVFQFINQGTRIVFSDFASANTVQGIIWTNTFFALSFLMGAVAGGWILWESRQLRRAHPGKFGLGPVEAAKEMYKSARVVDGNNKAKTVVDLEAQEEAQGEGNGYCQTQESSEQEQAQEFVDPTQDPSHIVWWGKEKYRAGMRLFGM